MDFKILLLLCMIFCHIIDDYYLQGCLASMKQKEWWNKNVPQELYKHDYLMALFMHSFSWAFMITLPLTIYTFIVGGTWKIGLFLANIYVHFYTDNLKANKKEINLIQDQLIHIGQIVSTWIIWFL